MRHPIHGGFTLLELMIVVVIMAVLLALLMPTMQDVWAVADHYRCTTNLFYLSQAIALRRNDRAMSSKGDVRTLTWPNQLLPYLEQGALILMCPVPSVVESPAATGEGSAEDGSGPGSDPYWGTGPDDVPSNPSDAYKAYPPLTELAELKMGSRFLTLDASPYTLKLSEEQFQPAYAQGWFGIDNSLNYARQHIDCTYRPGSDPYVYYLCSEDSNDPVTGGSNQDFNDVVIRVVDKRDGTYELTATTATAGSHSLVSKPDGKTLLQMASGGYGGRPLGGGQVSVGVAEEEEAPGPTPGPGSPSAPPNDYDPASSSGSKTIVSSNYAMNADNRYLPSLPAKVALLDYYRYLFHYTDDWGARALDPNQDGRPNFARHWGRINVLMIDGSVQLMEPAELNPAAPEAYLRYWAP